MLNVTVETFQDGLITSLESQAIPDGASSDSLN